MSKRKTDKDMTVMELARITNRAFGDLEIRFDGIDEQFRDIRSELRGFATKRDLHETEGRLLAAIGGVEVKRPEFDALKNDVTDLSGRVTFLEKRP
jgi:hypothetical protein